MSDAYQEEVLAQCVMHTEQRPRGEPGGSEPEVDTSTARRGNNSNAEQKGRFPAGDVPSSEVWERHRPGRLLAKPGGSEPTRHTPTALRRPTKPGMKRATLLNTYQQTHISRESSNLDPHGIALVLLAMQLPDQCSPSLSALAACITDTITKGTHSMAHSDRPRKKRKCIYTVRTCYSPVPQLN